MTKYLILRHGSNSANQPMRQTMPVAIVEAASRAEACRTGTPDDPTIADAAWLALDSDVDVWANQTLEAIPLSKAPRSLVREVEESSRNPFGYAEPAAIR